MERIKNKFSQWNEGSNGPSKYDMIAALAIVLLISCFFCFLKDFKLTVMQSLTFDSCIFKQKETESESGFGDSE